MDNGKGEPNPGLVSWLQLTAEVFWISGKPGCGESTMKYALQSLNERRENNPRILSFFFYQQDTIYAQFKKALYNKDSQFRISTTPHSGVIGPVEDATLIQTVADITNCPGRNIQILAIIMLWSGMDILYYKLGRFRISIC
jgi:hypothetical protein